MLDPIGATPTLDGKGTTVRVVGDLVGTQDPNDPIFEELAAKRSPYVIPKGTTLMVTMDAVAAVMNGESWQRQGWSKLSISDVQHAWLYSAPDRECPVMVVSLENSKVEPGVDTLVYLKCHQFGVAYPTLPACVGQMEEIVRFQVRSLVGLAPSILDQIYVHINRDRLLCLDWPPTVDRRDDDSISQVGKLAGVMRI